jgi:hypothetical protein
VRREDQETQTGGKRRLALGRIRVESEITREWSTFSYGVLHLGDHNISGGVRPYEGPESYKRMKGELTELFRRDHVPEMIRAVDRLFGGEAYTLRFLFRDEQQKIVRVLMETALEHASALYRSFYREYGPLARFLTGLSIPVPHRFGMAIDFTLNQDLAAAFSNDELQREEIRSLVDQIRAAGVGFDSVTLEFALRKVLERRAREWRERAGDMEPVRQMETVLDILELLPFQPILWEPQNIAYDLVRRNGHSDLPKQWREASARIAERLGVAAS